MSTGLRPVTVKFEMKVFEQIKAMADRRGENASETIRFLIKRGLDERIYKESADLMAGIVREQLELVLGSYGLCPAVDGTKHDLEMGNSRLDGRVSLRRVFKDNIRCMVGKVQFISWDN
jgi:ribosomal protein L1